MDLSDEELYAIMCKECAFEELVSFYGFLLCTHIIPWMRLLIIVHVIANS